MSIVVNLDKILVEKKMSSKDLCLLYTSDAADE